MKLAAFTIATKDDGPFLKYLVKHNLKSCDKMYILDNGLTKEEKAVWRNNDKVEIKKVKQSILLGLLRWALELTLDWSERLLKTYDWVLFTSPDEVVVADPNKYQNLKEFIHALDAEDGIRPRRKRVEHVYCKGYEVRHVHKDEPPLDPNKKILEQRRYWHFSPPYNKPLLSRVILEWVVGHHKIDKESDDDQQYRFHKDLYLIHLKWFDRNICKPRLSRTMKPDALERNFDTYPEPLELIPHKFKKVI